LRCSFAASAVAALLVAAPLPMAHASSNSGTDIHWSGCSTSSSWGTTKGAHVKTTNQSSYYTSNSNRRLDGSIYGKTQLLDCEYDDTLSGISALSIWSTVTGNALTGCTIGLDPSCTISGTSASNNYNTGWSSSKLAYRTYSGNVVATTGSSGKITSFTTTVMGSFKTSASTLSATGQLSWSF